MNIKPNITGAKNKKYESAQGKFIPPDKTVQKADVFQYSSRPSPMLSDSEFPSLSESYGIASTSSSSAGRILKYSDKLKLNPSSENQSSFSRSITSKNNVTVADKCDQSGDPTYHSKFSSSWNYNSDKKGVQSNSQNDSNKSNYVNTKKVNMDLNQNPPRNQPNQSLKESLTLNKQLRHSNKVKLCSQKQLAGASKSFKLSPSDKKSNSTSANYLSKSNDQRHSKMSIKFGEEKDEIKDEDVEDMQCNSTAKKKKKRKSKVKRQVALQSGKITVLTPEVHFKIVNQTSALILQSSKSVLTDINDEEEYPELGKSLVPSSQKENCPKKEISVKSSKNSADKLSNLYPEEMHFIKDSLSYTVMNEITSPEKKAKNDSKSTVHPNDPINVSFYDILLNKNSKPKVRDYKEEMTVPNCNGLDKIKIKKNTSHPHNLLDSSSPMIKRGKERENPKPKKPSQLKKIILLDRKARKEQLLQLKSNNSEESNVIDDESLEVNAEKLGDEISSLSSSILSENFIGSISQPDENDQTLLPVPKDVDSLVDKFVAESDNLLVVVDQINDDLCSVSTVKEDNNLNNLISNLSINDRSRIDEGDFESKADINVKPSDLNLNVSLNNVQKSEIPNKEKAAKVLLHTRNFREYCNHLISKDIDDAVYSLLDDLARFQDRLHQKDPVKARMKRRMIYGVKEVKKHIKLRKLKCIIIAADIENVEAQGGLNDVLNDIKIAAAEHHIPCIFALNRKVLGKVCRKPVSVSCVGIFNFEGSEANFKKMVELQAQSKADYNEIFNKLALKLTDKEITTLLKAKKEAPETLRTIRIDILNDFFMQPKPGAIESDTTNYTYDSIKNDYV